MNESKIINHKSKIIKVMAKKSALGKGLGALLQDAAEEAKPRGGSSAL